MSDEFLPKPFHCDVAHSDGTARLRPAGELDMSTVRVLEQRTSTEAHAAGAPPDRGRPARARVHGLDRADAARRAGRSDAERDGYDFALIAGSERIQRLFELTGLRPHFTFVAG